MYKSNFELALFNAAMALMTAFAGLCCAVFWPIARMADVLHA